MTPQPLYVRVSAAPLVFGVSSDTIYQWADLGHIQI